MQTPENQEAKEVSPREKLHALELEGKYVFHGSPGHISILEPKQAYNFGKEHGEPSIVATPMADVAIFRAVINSKNFPENHASSFGVNEDGTLHFEASKDILENIKSKKGFVYVLSKAGFKSFEGSPMEFRSTKETAPEEVIEVTADDLPESIGIYKNK
jgi:hypothetical protein